MSYSNVNNSFNLNINKNAIYVPSIIKPKNSEVIKFLDMSYDEIEKNGIPEVIWRYLKTHLEALLLNTNIDEDYLNATNYKILIESIDQIQGATGWKKFSNSYLSNFAILLKQLNPNHQPHMIVSDLSGLDIFTFEGVKEKLLTLCAEGIARKNHLGQMEKGEWRVVNDSVHTVLIYRCFENNAWGFASVPTMTDERTPTLISRMPFAINVLRDAISSQENNLLPIFIGSLKNRLPLESLFLMDTSFKAQEQYKGIYLTFGYSPITFTSKKIIISASASFYAGPIDFSKNTPNGRVINFLIDPMTGIISLDPYEKDCDIITNRANKPAFHAYQFSLESIRGLKDQALQYLASNSLELEVSYSISFPESEKEWNNQEILLLTELGKDLEQNKPGAAQTILALANALDIEIPETDLSLDEKNQLESTGSVAVSPKTLITSMKKNALKTFVKMSKEESAMTPSSSLIGKKELKVSEKEKNVKQITQKSKNVKQQKKSKHKSESNNNNESKTAQVKNKQIVFSKDEKEVSRSVMKGNAQKSSDFNKVARGMLEKILGEEASTIKEIKDGSHLVLHFEQNGIGKGLTLVKKHGNKDAMAMVFNQKRTLKDLFELKDKASDKS